MSSYIETYDVLNRSALLSRAHVNRQYFDPANAEHRESLRAFIETGNWGKIQFKCEYPFTDVPMTVLMKLAAHHLGAKSRAVENEVEHSA